MTEPIASQHLFKLDSRTFLQDPDGLEKHEEELLQELERRASQANAENGIAGR